MAYKVATLMKTHSASYSFNRTIIPFPSPVTEKIKPPVSADGKVMDSSHLFVSKGNTLEEQARQYMDDYKKAERMLVINFYTGGGGAYRKGILDAIYRGYNPMKM